MTNDYEILYYFKEGNINESFEILAKKYDSLIRKTVRHYFFNYGPTEDYIQEALEVLLIACKSFSEDYQKTFTRYFELLLSRRYQRIKKETINFYPIENVDDISDFHNQNELEMQTQDISLTAMALKIKSSIEGNIFQKIIQEDWTIKEVCDHYGYSNRAVYNSLGRVKLKIIKYLTDCGEPVRLADLF